MARPDDLTAPELEALPAPRRRARSFALALMTVTAAAALVLGGSIFSEARYAFEADEPTDVGNFATAELGPALTGRFVRARVAVEGRPALAFHRPGEIERRLSLAAPASSPGGRLETSSQGPRFVEYAVPKDAGARFVPPRLVAGRLERVGELGLRHRGLSVPLEAMAAGAGTSGWVLIDGEEPHAADWAVALELILLAFLSFNVASIARIIRKKPVA